VRILALSLALTACVPATPLAEPAPTEDACGASRVAGHVGQVRSDALVQEFARTSGARRVRWIGPGDVVTMDYSAERLNVHLDAQGRIAGFSCG
jgi:translation initiation factor IF-1